MFVASTRRRRRRRRRRCVASIELASRAAPLCEDNKREPTASQPVNFDLASVAQTELFFFFCS